MLKPILMGLLAGGLLWAQNPETAVFPAAVATDKTLFVAANEATTALTGAITSVAQTTFNVAVASRFIPPTLVRIDAEVVAVCSKNATTLVACTVAADGFDGRGFSGTSAATHLTKSAVTGTIDRSFHNRLSVEMIAVQTKLHAETASVRDFGAHGNGTDLDTAHIQAAIDAAEATQGLVYFPTGTYLIDAPLTITAPAAIRCADKTSTVIKASAGFTGTAGLVISAAYTGKYDGSLYGVSNCTFDFRLALTTDIIQVGSGADIGVGIGVRIKDNNFFGGKRWINIQSAGPGWIESNYFVKSTSDYDGIYMDMTANEGGWALANNEIMMDGAVGGKGNAMNFVCDSAIECYWAIVNNNDVLGKWNSAINVEDTAITLPTIGIGMYVVINGLVTECFFGSHAVVFKNAGWSQITGSWIANVTTTGNAAAIYLENSPHMMITGNFIASLTGGSEIQLDGGYSHIYTGNRFLGVNGAFNFNATRDTINSVVGFNFYHSAVTTQTAKWLAFVEPGTYMVQPVINPPHIYVKGTGSSVIKIENGETGATAPRKLLTINSAGELVLINSAGAAVIWSLSDAGTMTTPIVNATAGYYINAAPGLTKAVSVRKGDDSAACTMTFTGGILTVQDCTP